MANKPLDFIGMDENAFIPVKALYKQNAILLVSFVVP